METEVIKAEHVLVAQAPPARIVSVRFAVFLALCLALHAVLVWFMLTYSFQPVLPDPEPISVEIVPEPPPEEKPPQQEEKPEEPPKTEEAQTPQKLTVIDEKPATDAPRPSEGDEGHQDAKTNVKSGGEAKPRDQAPAPAPEQAPEPPKQQASAAREPSPDPRPNAEIIEPAAPNAQALAQPEPAPKPPTPAPKSNSVAEQFAALQPVPNMDFTPTGRRTNFPGGNADPGYLSTIYGMIMQQIRPPPPTGLPRTRQGVVEFFVGPKGRLMGARMTTSSGIPALDAAALAAVLAAAPYPAPPGGGVVALTFGY